METTPNLPNEQEYPPQTEHGRRQKDSRVQKGVNW